jgi:dCTP deaminase
VILSGDEIIRRVGAKDLLIEPFDQRAKQPNGWEVRLGPWWFAPTGRIWQYEPWSAMSQQRYWGEPQVPNHSEGKAICIPPHTVILGHTLEWIGALRDYVPYLRCRSGVARSSATICSCAGFGEVGYAFRWTVEIENRTSADMILPVGARIGQVVFSPLETGGFEDQDLYTGSYGKSVDQWSPWDMLPKLPGDWDKPDHWSFVPEEERERLEKWRSLGPVGRRELFGLTPLIQWCYTPDTTNQSEDGNGYETHVTTSDQAPRG